MAFHDYFISHNVGTIIHDFPIHGHIIEPLKTLVNEVSYNKFLHISTTSTWISSYVKTILILDYVKRP